MTEIKPEQPIRFTGNRVYNLLGDQEDREKRLADIHEQLTSSVNTTPPTEIEKPAAPVDDRFTVDPVSGRLRYADDWRDR